MNSKNKNSFFVLTWLLNLGFIPIQFGLMPAEVTNNR
jgi:hypothetical protein